MKKEELVKIKLPLSREDFEKLKRAMDYQEIERPDFPIDLLLAMDKMWAEDNQDIFDDYYRRGIFGDYD